MCYLKLTDLNLGSNYLLPVERNKITVLGLKTLKPMKLRSLDVVMTLVVWQSFNPIADEGAKELSGWSRLTSLLVGKQCLLQ